MQPIIIIICGGCGGVGGTHKPECKVPMDDTWRRRRAAIG